MVVFVTDISVVRMSVKAHTGTPLLEISCIATKDKIPYNLTLKKCKGFWGLKCNSYLVINKAVKGSTLNVQDSTDYKEIPLNTSTTICIAHTNYVDDDPINSIYRGINQVLYNFHSEELLNRSIVSLPKKARFARPYLVIKMHKTPMGIRPIGSSFKSFMKI